MANLPLLKFTPLLLEKPWGGNSLWAHLGKGSSQDQNMGEAWEISDRPEAFTVVSGGEYSGLSLANLWSRFGSTLLGEGLETQRFPLLYKFICAREKLSVQVHPGSGSSLGEAKTECWYVVEADPGAALIVGITARDRTRSEILECLKSSQCEEVLRRWPAQRGDVFFIPAGTVHAITEGLLLYEVQQNSDTTFRLYDWGRRDAQGRSRTLHLEEAVAVADTEEREGFKIPPLTVDRGAYLESFRVVSPYFALVQWSRFSQATSLQTQGRFRVVTVVSGSVSLQSETIRVQLSLGETALVPACLTSVLIEATPDAELLISYVPRIEEEIREPLRKAGFSALEIGKLFGPEGIRV